MCFTTRRKVLYIFQNFQKNSKNTNLYTKIFTPFYERTSWVQIMKFNKGRKSRDTLPLMKCLSQVLVGSHLMGRMDHYLIADQSGADPHRVELAKQRSTYCMYRILKNKQKKTARLRKWNFSTLSRIRTLLS